MSWKAWKPREATLAVEVRALPVRLHESDAVPHQLVSAKLVAPMLAVPLGVVVFGMLAGKPRTGPTLVATPPVPLESLSWKASVPDDRLNANVRAAALQATV